jgi:hypothetical protein
MTKLYTVKAGMGKNCIPAITSNSLKPWKSKIDIKSISVDACYNLNLFSTQFDFDFEIL